MVFSHCAGTGPEPVAEPSRKYRNVHTGPGQGAGPIVSYGASSIPCTGPGPVPVQCQKAITVSLPAWRICP